MWFLIFFLVVVFGILYWHKRYYVLQYLFFLRYPLLLAAVLILLPMTAYEFAGKPFRNMFVLETPEALALVTFCALIVAWQCMYLAGFLYEHSAHRLKINFNRSKKGPQWLNSIPDSLKPRRVRLTVSGLLAVPIVFTCIRFSLADVPQNPELEDVVISGVDVVIGLLGGAVFAYLGNLLLDYGGKFRWVGNLAYGVVRLTAGIDRFCFRSTTIETDRQAREDRIRTHTFRMEIISTFAVLTLIVYAVLWWSAPEEGGLLSRFNMPVMIYILLLLMLVTWILSWLSYLLDRHRLLPELVLLPLIGGIYAATGSDHFFNLREQEGWKGTGCMDVAAAETTGISPGTIGLLETPPNVQLASRREWAKTNARPVIVATSGGGITAAYWTAVVLTQLEKDVSIPGNAGFSDVVMLISGTSGGSVGSLYYVDAFEAKQSEARPFNAVELQRIREGAGTSSLNAVGWGLVYRDFWRIVFPLLVSKDADRASAMETRWRQGLLPNRRRWDSENPPQPEKVHDPSFGDWAKGVREGWRPAAVFNATLVESGELLQIANVALPTSSPGTDPEAEKVISKERSFIELFPKADIGAVTAARLSATFPWVTPAARPDLDDKCDNLYHVADGGFYDNYGVLSALKYIEALPEGAHPILIEIRASNSRETKKPEEGGFALAAIGPLKTLLNVRSTSQLSRNEELVRIAERKGLISRVVFELREPAPLSWHLSALEREEIKKEWQEQHIQGSLHELCVLLGVSCNAL
jgi:hypothetical protein